MNSASLFKTLRLLGQKPYLWSWLLLVHSFFLSVTTLDIMPSVIAFTSTFFFLAPAV